MTSIFGSPHQKKDPFFLMPTPNDPLFSTKSYTKCPLLSFFVTCMRMSLDIRNWTLNHDILPPNGKRLSQWRSQRGAGGATAPWQKLCPPSCPPNEITLCTEVYGELPFWVPVTPPAHSWAPLAAPSICKELILFQTKYWVRYDAMTGTVRYFDVSFLRTVFIPNGFCSERLLFRQVVSPNRI